MPAQGATLKLKMLYTYHHCRHDQAAFCIRDENMGHHVDRELAHVYFMIKENDKAPDPALAEYNQRPENIDVNETLGWVYYKRGKSSKALTQMNTALRSRCKNPTLLCHAGLALANAGKKAEAKNF